MKNNNSIFALPLAAAMLWLSPSLDAQTVTWDKSTVTASYVSPYPANPTEFNLYQYTIVGNALVNGNTVQVRGTGMVSVRPPFGSPSDSVTIGSHYDYSSVVTSVGSAFARDPGEDPTALNTSQVTMEILTEGYYFQDILLASQWGSGGVAKMFASDLDEIDRFEQVFQAGAVENITFLNDELRVSNPSNSFGFAAFRGFVKPGITSITYDLNSYGETGERYSDAFFAANIVPEPSALILLGTTSVVGLLRRRR